MPDQTEQLRAEVARLRDALDATVGHITNLEPSRDEALAMAEAALSTPAPPDPRAAKLAIMREALERARQGWRNIIEMRRMTNGRYGNLTKEEIFESIMEIESALFQSPGEWLEEQRRQAKIEVLEQQPCTHRSSRPEHEDCIVADTRYDAVMLCPRCKALAELKGDRG